jgi:hypothetical protein
MPGLGEAPAEARVDILEHLLYLVFVTQEQDISVIAGCALYLSHDGINNSTPELVTSGPCTIRCSSSKETIGFVNNENLS